MMITKLFKGLLKCPKCHDQARLHYEDYNSAGYHNTRSYCHKVVEHVKKIDTSDRDGVVLKRISEYDTCCNCSIAAWEIEQHHEALGYEKQLRKVMTNE